MLIEPGGLGEKGAKLGFVRALINHVEQRRSRGRSGLPDQGLSSGNVSAAFLGIPSSVQWPFSTARSKRTFSTC